MCVAIISTNFSVSAESAFGQFEGNGDIGSPAKAGSARYDAANQELISRAARLAYPIRDGIPIMLPEEARKIDDMPGAALLTDRS